MSLRVIFSVRATDEIDAAYNWLADHYGDAAEKWHTELLTAIEALGEHSERHPLAENEGLAAARVREMLFGRRRKTYRVWYRVEGDAVRILSIRHHIGGRSTRRTCRSDGHDTSACFAVRRVLRTSHQSVTAIQRNPQVKPRAAPPTVSDG